tara:strand:+ start:91 stop:312 length:222 start_codon:yes stop_codon:yes gene_type:complete
MFKSIIMKLLNLFFTIFSLTLIFLISFYYIQKFKTKFDYEKLKKGKEVSEKEKIRVYINRINEKFRKKNRLIK